MIPAPGESTPFGALAERSHSEDFLIAAPAPRVPICRARASHRHQQQGGWLGHLQDSEICRRKRRQGITPRRAAEVDQASEDLQVGGRIAQKLMTSALAFVVRVSSIATIGRKEHRIGNLLA